MFGRHRTTPPDLLAPRDGEAGLSPNTPPACADLREGLRPQIPLESERTPSGEPVGCLSDALQRACAELSSALIDFAARRSVLDDVPLMGASEADVIAALYDVRSARRRCERAVESMLRQHPMTAAEVLLMRDVLSSYCTQLDVDHLTRHSFFRGGSGLGPEGPMIPTATDAAVPRTQPSARPTSLDRGSGPIPVLMPHRGGEPGPDPAPSSRA